MTAHVSSVPEVSPPPETAPIPRLSAEMIDRSCRMPVMVLFLAAAVWLGFGAILSVITAIKAHAPGFLAEPAWLTYGRVRPAAGNALVYGFVLQAALGLGLWMSCRLGRNLLEGRRILATATGFWNLGLLLGIMLILAGESTGYEWLEMPGLASPILFLSYVLLGAWAVINLHARRERDFYVSQWFWLAGLLWFPWVYSTAQLLLVYFPVRGVMQAVVSGWYAQNLFELALAPFGLAAIFYFIPKLTGQPLHSRGLALFGFWLLILLGGWGGVPMGYPVPNWISAVGVVAQVFLLAPILAFAMSWIRTLTGNRAAVKTDLVLRFIVVGALSYLVAAGLNAMTALPGVSRITVFTLFNEGVSQLTIHGFLAMTLAGGIYFAGQRIGPVNWPSKRWMQIHFWSATAGLVVLVLALLIGGVVHGAGMERADTDFVRVTRSLVPFLGMSTLGTTLLLVGYLAFIGQLFRLMAVFWPAWAPWPRTAQTQAVAPGRTPRTAL